jgi:hypothetical protein
MSNKLRLLSGNNWTINDNESIYSGVVRIDTVRIEFSKENCMIFHVVHEGKSMIIYEYLHSLRLQEY